MELYETVQDALKNNEFYLEYLPIIDLVTNRCVGAEALVRWNRQGQLVYPAEFIPQIENTPAAGLLTYWVMDELGREMLDFIRANPTVYFAINIPPMILGRGGLPYAGEKSGLYEFPKQIVLEITERGIPDEIGLLGLDIALNLGVRLALDDVTLSGTNAAVLARCNMNIIKLDRSLTQQIDESDLNPAWLTTLSALMINSTFDVVAEGVETQRQLRAIKEAGVQYAQGFLFARPMRSQAFFDYYRTASREALPTRG